MQKERYSSCSEWIKGELANVDVPSIEMVISGEDLNNRNLSEYSAIFIGGGNTFKLLKVLKTSGSFDKIKDYIENNGVVFGVSAGAIIFGQCIDTCKYADKNEVELQDLMGFDAVSYYSLLCHYTNQDQEKIKLNKDYLIELSKEEKIIALPEEDTIFVNNSRFEIIGDKPFYIFEEENIIEYNSNIDKINDYYLLKNQYELMDFMNSNITYGWIDNSNGMHFNSLMGFRKDYRTSSIQEILNSGLGTCIEQAKLEKDFFDRIGLKNKLYCHRGYETEDNFEQNVRMHCFIIFKYKNDWYHFEHSNRPKRGIHYYPNIEDAIKNITSGFEASDLRMLTEIPDIPDGLSFKEFNNYVNQFNNLKSQKR